ncbi:MAG: phosphoribosylformylglycinamidine synthase subunit PurQ [Bdellovibrionales bacterium]|nr:phosphoribosylformylglycinamidine synthase subunit PurQ [Bdellovibrionales bacterium]
MKVGIVRFAGTNCEQDVDSCYRELLGCETQYIWHRESSLPHVDLLVLPGGFSFGDYLRCGALARLSPIMSSVKEFAAGGGAVVGICNGFQILCEVGLLPGVLLQNESMKFVSRFVPVRVESSDSVLTFGVTKGTEFLVPIAHFDGRYFLSESELRELEAHDQVLLRYTCRDGFVPNGAVSNIAGVRNREGNVVGLMPHPERACESSLSLEGIGTSLCVELLRASIRWCEARADGSPMKSGLERSVYR